MGISAASQRYLRDLARETIRARLDRRSKPEIDLDALSPELRADGASFVTLTTFGSLRGCIGTIEPHRPLAVDVRENAIGAAFGDPRFPPLAPGEFPNLQIEISVLTVPRPLAYDSCDDLLAQLRPGIDGVIIEQGWHRATFLPQVWEQLPGVHPFLEHLCRKAGLSADAYRQGNLSVSVYQVEKF